MLVYIILTLHFMCLQSAALWDKDVTCPLVCTCRMERLKETAIYRFIRDSKEDSPKSETDLHLNNDVFYEDDLDNQFLEDNPMLQTVICMLQTETTTPDLLEVLPKDINSLTLIQGANSGNKTITFSQLQNFESLMILELYGTNMNDKNDSSFFCEIDKPLPKLKYLNLDKISMKVSKNYLIKLDTSDADAPVTIEYEQQLKPNLHPLIMVQKVLPQEIIPYSKFITQEDSNKLPLFHDFKNLFLLRINGCKLNKIKWEMFDGLQNLQYLIIEKNNLKVIPDFAFYGTPNLKTLSLAWNDLLNIQITDLAGLLELEYLDLSHNNFSQLSELSFPPFPNLKLANFKNNPINIVFPYTFEVMNTTHSLILGNADTSLTLTSNSFLGLKMLKKLTLHNLTVPILKRELLIGMPNLHELIMTGNITNIEYDAFLEVLQLKKLIMAHCSLQNISMDSFIGLNHLEILDLSYNNFEFLPPGTFDPLKNLKELYLNGNRFRYLPKGIFHEIHAKLIRLDENPWHCSCRMSDWKPMIVNKIKQKIAKHCNFHHDKGVGCTPNDVYSIKYVFDASVAPKCRTPRKFVNWNVFHAMRKQLRCSDYKPKIKKKVYAPPTLNNTVEASNNIPPVTYSTNYTYPINNKLNPVNLNKPVKLAKQPEISNNYNKKHDNDVPIRMSLFSSEIMTNNDEDNNLNYFPEDYSSLNQQNFQVENTYDKTKLMQKYPTKFKKQRKHVKFQKYQTSVL